MSEKWPQLEQRGVQATSADGDVSFYCTRHDFPMNQRRIAELERRWNAFPALVAACEKALSTLDFWAKMGVNVDDTWNARVELRKAVYMAGATPTDQLPETEAAAPVPAEVRK